MAFYRQRGLRQLSTEVTTEGIGIGGGFIVGGVIGRKVEEIIKPSIATSTDKLIAWAANNGAKAATYVLARKYDANTQITREATRAIAGSIVYDTIVRLTNNGINPYDVRLAGYRVLNQNNPNVQKLLQENSTLRTELNKALQRLAASPAANAPVAAAPDIKNMPGYNPDMPGFRYAAIPDPLERQRRFGAMDDPLRDPLKYERERKYGAMPVQAPVQVPEPIVPPLPTTQPVDNPAAEAQIKFGAMPYGAMPFWGPTVQEKRERRYGFAAAQGGASASAEMYGML